MTLNIITVTEIHLLKFKKGKGKRRNNNAYHNANLRSKEAEMIILGSLPVMLPFAVVHVESCVELVGSIWWDPLP